MKKFEVKENGIKIISKSGKIFQFDENYELIKSSKLKYFFFMGPEEKDEVVSWLNEIDLSKCRSEAEEEFLRRVKEAVTKIKYGYYIATIEPSMDYNGKIVYHKGLEVWRELMPSAWENKAKEYAPEYGSELANLYELYLWYAYRIAKNYWSLEYVCSDSSKKSNYLGSADGGKVFELSGQREIGRFCDGIGNTKKLVFSPEYGLVTCGGSKYEFGFQYPIAKTRYVSEDTMAQEITGVVVLKDVNE